MTEIHQTIFSIFEKTKLAKSCGTVVEILYYEL